jgi:FkbM family methyltransferase
LVIDLGANTGAFAHALIARVGCRVYAAEPVGRLRARIKPSPRLFVLGVAVGGMAGSVLLDASEGHCPHVISSTWARPSKVERAEMVPLDTFFSRAGVSQVDLLKVDIEGSELDMFDSVADSTLLKIPQITVEFHDFIDKSSRVRARVENTKRRLGKMGFAVVPFSRNNTDVLFINRVSTELRSLDIARIRYISRNLCGAQRLMNRLLFRSWNSNGS